MKTRAWLIVLGAALLSIAAFYVGFQNGKKKMDAYCGLVIQVTSAGDHSTALSLHASAIKALRDGNSEEAARLLHILARADAQAITACEKDSHCKTMSGRGMADGGIVQESLAWK
jgi:hypothetical protein